MSAISPRALHRALPLCLLPSVLLLGACATEAADEGGPLTHTFPVLTLEPTSEIGAGVNGPCQSWTLGNEETLWINRVVATNGGGWHHSNWFIVQEGEIGAEDGTFKCSDEGIVAPMGQIFFAQTTQSLGDVQDLGEGVAFEVPPHSVVIGQMHMLNTSDEPMDTTTTFEVHTLPEEEVVIPLRSSTVSLQNLEIPANADTHEFMDCNLPTALQGEALHYVLPHYHAMGRRLYIETTYEDGSTATIFEGDGYGEASGELLSDRPMLGKSIRMGCEFENDSDTAVEWGWTGADEMCVALLYTTGSGNLLGSNLLGNCGFISM